MEKTLPENEYVTTNMEKIRICELEKEVRALNVTRQTNEGEIAQLQAQVHDLEAEIRQINRDVEIKRRITNG